MDIGLEPSTCHRIFDYCSSRDPRRIEFIANDVDSMESICVSREMEHWALVTKDTQRLLDELICNGLDIRSSLYCVMATVKETFKHTFTFVFHNTSNIAQFNPVQYHRLVIGLIDDTSKTLKC